MAPNNTHRQHYFAPGAIEHHIHSRAHQRRALVRWLKRAALLVAATAWLLLVFTAVASTAHAQTPQAVGVHLVSHHFSAPPKGHPGWNDTNPGIYARWANGVTVGTLLNSERRQSVYLAMTWETPRWHGLSAAITAGGITGYAKPVSPLLAASGSLALTDHTAVRLTLLPKAHPKASAAAHLSVEWSF